MVVRDGREGCRFYLGWECTAEEDLQNMGVGWGQRGCSSSKTYHLGCPVAAAVQTLGWALLELVVSLLNEEQRVEGYSPSCSCSSSLGAAEASTSLRGVSSVERNESMVRSYQMRSKSILIRI